MLTFAGDMSMFVCSLNSGSNANCYYLGNEEEAILIDGGLSCRETEKRLKRLGLSIKKVRAIFVSHEHGDHIHGVPSLSRKHGLPVYLTPETLRHGQVRLRDDLTSTLHPYQAVTIGKLVITAFPKLHDASDPVSFLVECASVKVGVFTDIGVPCDHVIRHFRQCHAAFLEANYDEGMLKNGRYPLHLKKRILSDKGHMSNDQAVELFVQHRPSYMSHLFLSHLSRDNNSPDLVKKVFEKIAGTTEIVIASRDRESALYHIRNQPQGQLVSAVNKRFKPQLQLSLF